MNAYLLLPLLVGISTVLQGGINRFVVEKWGLPATLFLNALVFLAVSIVYFLGASFFRPYLPPLFEEFLDHRQAWLDPKVWYVIPGLCGFVIVLLLPIAIKPLGATKLVVTLVATQLVMGFLWDVVVMSDLQVMTWKRLTGVALAMIGAYLCTL